MPILFFLVFKLTCVYAQQANLELFQNGYYIRQYSELSGLVSNKCKYVFEDSRGFLWISTFQGLSRFDGERFTNFGLENGLPSVNITQVCEDTSGYIYVATAKGIVRYTGRQRANSDTCFYIYPSTTDFSSSISGMQVIDSNHIIFQQIGKGLYLLKNKKLSVLYDGVLEYEMSIVKDRSHTIYAYARDSFRIYNKQLQLLRTIPFPAADFMTFYYDNTRNILEAYSKGKTYRLNPGGLTYTGKAPDSISWFWITPDEKKFYYSSGRNNLYFFDGSKSTRIIDLAALSLSSNDLRQTKDGSIWVTTNSGGLLKIVPLPYQEVTQGTPALIRHTKGRNLIDINTSQVQTSSAGFAIPKSLFIYSVFAAKDGNTWYCTRNGIYQQEPGGKALLYDFTGNEKLFSGRAKEVKGVAEDLKGDLWFYGYSGILLYSNKHFKQFTNRNGLSEDILVRQLVIEKSGTVLLTDWYNLYKVQGDSVIRITNDLRLRNYIPNKIATDNLGSAWIDYNKKLYKVEKLSTGNFSITDSIVPYPISAAGEIASFEFDTNNNCWISYNGGSIKVFFHDGTGYSYTNSVTYTIDDGISPVTGGEFLFHPAEHGDMTLTTKRNGVDRIFVFTAVDALERKKTLTAQVSITEILINQSTPDWKRLGYLVGPMGIPEALKLNYSQNDIAFTYKATSLRSSEAIIYQVMLKGYNDMWVTTTQSISNYTNLPAGDYSFIVKAANANGTWSDPFVYTFTILPPWYKTWWGLTILLLLAASLIFFLFYLRLKSVRKREALAHLKKSDKFKTILISLLGHDIIIPLQYIGKVAAQLKNYNQQISTQTQIETLGDIQLTASQLQLYGESIIHWIKVQNSEFSNSLKKEILIHDILDELVLFHQSLCAAKNNTIEKAYSADIRCWQDPLVIKVIIHNLLINANKFTTGGKIIIGCTMEEDYLALSVKDTGKGMDQEKVISLNNFKPLDSDPGTHKETGWGIGYTIIMDLLKFSKGHLHINSKLNEGTHVIIQLPIG